jgi:hypothetical protein
VNTPHICKDNGKCYTVIVNPQLSWEDAEEYCGNNFTNGQLASIHSAFDNARICKLDCLRNSLQTVRTKLIISAGWLPFLSSNPWIGAIRFGNHNFTWADGSDFDYTNWAPGQPSSGNCVQVCRTTTSARTTCQEAKWATSECSTQAQFVCVFISVRWTHLPLYPIAVPSIRQIWVGRGCMGIQCVRTHLSDKFVPMFVSTWKKIVCVIGLQSTLLMGTPFIGTQLP